MTIVLKSAVQMHISLTKLILTKIKFEAWILIEALLNRGMICSLYEKTDS